MPDAQRALSELTNASLVAERSPGRYHCHDLLRAYAAELALACDGDIEVRTARHRMLDYYRHAAERLAGPVQPAPELLTCTAE